MIKFSAYFLVVVGGFSTVFGLFPVIFLYPYKFSSTSNYLMFVLLQTEDRWFWQVGIVVLIIGVILIKKRKHKRALL